ncbi:MAG TPA: sigma-70 family RNA polymerase sigma factor [Gemmatimonadaceae bacterium]|nr:sigma-70 family RNA polymerase sigma factor [Gemmatimonadaceae bacterium]
MTGNPTPDLEQLLAEMRPMLHRYCARMTGSVIDGEDVVQEAMLKAFAARGSADAIANPRAWVVRIAHNAALDFLRRRAREPILESDELLNAIPVTPSERPDPEIVTAGLHGFMRLPTLQRAAVILKDVLDHSLEEVASITGVSLAAAKSALQRGREHLRAIAREPEEATLPALNDAARARLAAYVDGFTAGDFDAVRAMLAEDVELDLVARLRRRGKSEVGVYFARYADATQWAFAAGAVEGRPAMLVYDRERSLETPAYFVILDLEGDRVIRIRDFLFARYAMESVALRSLEP